MGWYVDSGLYQSPIVFSGMKAHVGVDSKTKLIHIKTSNTRSRLRPWQEKLGY